MTICKKKMISSIETNSSLSHNVQLKGNGESIMISENDVSRYVSGQIRFSNEGEVAADEDVDTISMRLIAKNRAAYEELAK